MAASCDILGYTVTTLNVEDLVEYAFNDDSLTVINTLNPHSYIESKNDTVFAAALKNSNFLIPDGSGITLAERIIHGKKLNKIAGYDLFTEIMNRLEMKGGKVFFLGSTEEVLSRIKYRASKDFPNVIVETLSPDYKPGFTKADIEKFASSISLFNPDVVFVGLTAPKQEKLIFQMNHMINVKIISGIGAVFDFYAGTVKRPKNIWIKLHMEWLVRFLGDPKRLWKRNFISTPLFLLDVLKCKIRF